MHATGPRFRSLVVISLVLLAASSDSERPLVAFLGDSITDGWGLSRKEAYPAIVGRQFDARGTAIVVLNAGRGGDTVSQGYERLGVVLRKCPDVLVVALGVNDAIRGLGSGRAEHGLRRILADAGASGVTVVLAGVSAPPAMTTSNTRRYEAMYRKLARDYAIPFVPNLLEGVSGDPHLMFPDGLHPNARGQKRLAENAMPAIELALKERQMHVAKRC